MSSYYPKSYLQECVRNADIWIGRQADSCDRYLDEKRTLQLVNEFQDEPDFFNGTTHIFVPTTDDILELLETALADLAAPLGKRTLQIEANTTSGWAVNLTYGKRWWNATHKESLPHALLLLYKQLVNMDAKNGESLIPSAQLADS